MQTSTREIIFDNSETAANAGVTEMLAVRAALSAIAAGFLTCALPRPDFGWLAWIALVPLIVACENANALAAAALGFLFGMASNVGIYRWLFEVHGFGIHHFLILSTYFSLYPLAWCAGISFFKRKGLPLIFVAPAFWIGLDYIRAHAGFMAFPWGTLAHTQHRNLAVLQIATITGEYGITFLVVLANAAIAGVLLNNLTPLLKRGVRGDFADTVATNKSPLVPLLQRGKELQVHSRQSIIVASLLVAVAHAWGAYVVYVPSPGQTIRVAAVQPSILVGERDTAAGRIASMARLERLTRVAAASNPALIVWPETAIAGNLRANPFFTTGLLGLAADVNTPIVSGVGEVEKFAVRDSQGKLIRRAYNTAYLLRSDGRVEEPYVKRVLLPFGEYVPLEDIVGWPRWLAPPVFSTIVGNKSQFFTLRNGVVFSPLICWENLFAPLARDAVQGGARLLVLLTNDGWFGRSAEPYQHNLASVLRAAENRIPIVVSSNTGPSQIIDPYGRIVAVAPRIFGEEVITGEISTAPAGTLYTNIGDLFTGIVLAMLAIAIMRPFLKEWSGSVTRPGLSTYFS